MIELKYKTRGMTNPNGKQRVYFCVHPVDFDTTFEKISNLLLKKCNCAIWYVEKNTVLEEEEVSDDLSQMQLFVIPITSNFLYTKNRAKDIEFRYAMEHHIPVLPLMQEQNLEEEFNSLCGNIQFLNPYAKDETAISYDIKLEQYLNTVLIGDEMAEKVRAAFDAYIFLSYRKKDRKYANELMRLIHKNDFCRDIAIWYDEFLVPGENFNESIERALEQSQLFTLVVTPNLVCEDNYVMAVEYPKAKDSGKQILPVELVATEPTLLQEKYPGIPMCVDSKNEVVLSESLLQAVQAMAIKENDTSMEHTFFIGLAYLKGIDVEVDVKRAVQLITEAADAGLIEAMEKLVFMYQNGDGVEISFSQAIEWQERLIDALESNFYKNRIVEDGEKLLQNIIDLYHIYHREWKYSEALAVCEKGVHLSEEILKEMNSSKLQEHLRTFYIKMGDIYRKKERISDAKQWYEKAYHLYELALKENHEMW